MPSSYCYKAKNIIFAVDPKIIKSPEENADFKLFSSKSRKAENEVNGFQSFSNKETLKINVSDVITYEFCPKQFYFQRVLKIIPPHLKALFSIGAKEHEHYETCNDKEHSEKPQAEEGKPYIMLFQEVPLFDAKNNISGRIDTLYVYGNAFLSDNDRRKALIIDKKRKMNEIYFLQVFGYAHLLDNSDKFGFLKPFETFGQIVHNAGSSGEIPITDNKKAEFLGKAEAMREHFKRMLEGEIPKAIKCSKCFNCYFKEKCFRGLLRWEGLK